MSWATLIPGLIALGLLAAAALRHFRLKRHRPAADPARQRRRLLEALLAAAPVPILIVDRQGRYLEEFPCGAGCPGRGLLERMPAETRAECLRCVQRVAGGGPRQQLRYQCARSWFVVDVLPLADGAAPAAAAVVIRDVTAQQRSASRLARLARRNDAILRSAMDGFFIADEQYRFLEVNEAFCRLTGYSAAELLQMKVTDLEVPAAQSGRPRPGTRTGLHQFATAHRHKDGHLIQLENSVIVLRDDGRKILVGFARDVTERCRAEQALLESEERYRTLFQQSRDAIYMSTGEGRLIDVNQAALELFGYSKQELLGRDVRELCASARERARLQRALEQPGGLKEYPLRLRRRGGAEMDCLLTATARAAADGTLLGYQGVIRDITARKRAEQALRESEAHYRAIVEGFDGLIYICSPEQRIEYVNNKLLQRCGFDPTGQPCYQVLHQRQAACPWCPGQQVYRGATVRREIRSPKDDRWYYMVSTPLCHADGRYSAMVMALDITERKRAEEQRRQLELRMQHSQRLESLGVLAGGVAHDFNNFLVGILGNASLALEKLTPGQGAARAHLQKIISVSQRASELTRQMLAYAGRGSCDARPSDLNALVNELAEFMRAALPKNVALTISTSGRLPPIQADGGQLQQVIMNLLINAAEAIGTRPGRVSVRTASRRLDPAALRAYAADRPLPAGQYVCLEVADDGCGMSPETQQRIFDPFFSTKFAGRGLGLAAMLGIVRAHGGAIRVSSRLNEGTLFSVVFPALPRGAPAARQPKPAARLPAGATVLVIDDEAEIREIVQAILERHGARVLLAGDGEAGLELFKRHADEIDLVLLDMTMPGLSGAEVFARISALRPQTRIVLASGYSEQQVSACFADRQLAGFIQKPYTLDALVAKVGASLASG